jgi:hypothetical protein
MECQLEINFLKCPYTIEENNGWVMCIPIKKIKIEQVFM